MCGDGIAIGLAYIWYVFLVGVTTRCVGGDCSSRYHRWAERSSEGSAGIVSYRRGEGTRRKLGEHVCGSIGKDQEGSEHGG